VRVDQRTGGVGDMDQRSAGRRVLIVEPNPLGHRLHYVKLLIDECRSKGDQVHVLTTTDAVESAEWGVHLSNEKSAIIRRPSNEFSLSKIAEVSARLGVALTVVPEADHHLVSVARRGWSGPGALTLLAVRAEVQARPPLARMRPAKSFVKKTLIWAANLRPGVRFYALRSPLASRRGPIRWVADPVALSSSSECVDAIRNDLDSQGNRYWLGVFGAITPRKNHRLIVEAILDQPVIGLLIAGSVDPKVSSEVAPLFARFISNGGRLIQLPGPLSDTDFDSAIAAVDCVLVAHSNEGPSGIVIKAAASGRRLVLAGAKSLRRDAVCLGEQATWSKLDVAELRRAIRQAQRAPKPTSAVDLGDGEFRRALT